MNIKSFEHKIVSLHNFLLTQAQRLNTGDVDAQDLVQETFLKLWNMREQLDSHPNLEALALRTLKGIAIDHYRHRQHECEQLSRKIDIGQLDEQVEHQDQIALVSRIVDRLPPLQRQVFMLKDIVGYETCEIQAMCGCSAEALRQNLSRARKFIRVRLLKELSFEKK